MRVVVSLTTIPSRVARIKPMLESLLAQTRKPDRMILWLPKVCRKEFAAYDVPLDLRQWMEANGIEVRECDIDWGSATKLIPTLLCELEDETIIITMDDDILYEAHAVEELVAASEKWPNDSLGFMGGVKGPCFIHTEQVRNARLERKAVDMLGGYRGILYRRKMFDGSVIDELKELLKEGAFVVDDQLFGWNLARRGIGRFVIQTNYPEQGNRLNFRFLGLGNGIYDDTHQLADDSIHRLEAMYEEKGWKV